jgi:hypothetical protein
MLQNTNQSRGKRTRDNEQDENVNSNNSSTFNSERHRNSPHVLHSNMNHDSSPRLPIPIGLPDPLTG